MTRVWSLFPSQFNSGRRSSPSDPWKAVTVRCLGDAIDSYTIRKDMLKI